MSVTPLLISGRSSLGTVSIRPAHLDRNIVVVRLPEGQKEDASKVADALADMFAYADQNPGEESRNRTINYTPENNSEMDYTKWEVLKLQDGPKTDAAKAAEFLVDMLTFADAAMESNEHSRIIEYAPESKGVLAVRPRWDQLSNGDLRLGSPVPVGRARFPTPWESSISVRGTRQSAATLIRWPRFLCSWCELSGATPLKVPDSRRGNTFRCG